MKYKARQFEKDWAVDTQDSEGRIHGALFSGPNAKCMAREYADWKNSKNEYETFNCHLAIFQEADNTFSSVVMNLPGAGSCGDTEDEAIANVREAISGVIKTYLHHGQPIPWQSKYKEPSDAAIRWITVFIETSDKTGY